METDDTLWLMLLSIFLVSVMLNEKIEVIERSVSEIPAKLLSFITSPIFIISIVVFVFVILIFIMIHSRNLRLKEEILETKRVEKKKELEEEIIRLSCRNVKGKSSSDLRTSIRVLAGYKQDSRIESKIIETREELKRVEIEEYRETEEYKKEKLQEEIKELREQKYLEELRLKDYYDAVLEKLKVEDTLVYEIEKLNKKEIEVLKKEDYKKTNEYDPIEKKNITFLVRQILNHSPTHTFLVVRIKQLLEKYISPSKIRGHDTRDADITFEVNYKIYAFEIERGSLLSKKKQLREKVSFLNNKYGQNWYFIVTNRDLAKKYREYGKVTSRMGVRKIIEKLIGN